MSFVAPNANCSTVVGVKLTDHGEFEVIRRYPSNLMFACYPAKPAPDRVTKEIYGVKEGKIVLDELIEGKHTLEHTISKSITFD